MQHIQADIQWIEKAITEADEPIEQFDAAWFFSTADDAAASYGTQTAFPTRETGCCGGVGLAA